MSLPITSPTPWTHRSTGGAETIVDRTGQTVAILGRGMEPGNGALIAAAPDLYAALEAAEALLKLHGYPAFKNSDSIRAQARAALKKAVGE